MSTRAEAKNLYINKAIAEIERERANVPENVRRFAVPNRREAPPSQHLEIGHSIMQRAPNTHRERKAAMRREIKRIVGNASS